MPSLSGLPERFAGPDRYPLAPSVDGLEDPSLSSEERPHSSALPVLLPERSRAKPPAPSAAARDRHGQLSPDEAQCTALRWADGGLTCRTRSRYCAVS